MNDEIIGLDYEIVAPTIRHERDRRKAKARVYVQGYDKADGQQEDITMTANELPAKDFRITNPKLHKLYVTYAQEDLQIMAEAIESFVSVSRVSMTICAGLIQEQRALLLKSDAAYQEALWRIQANDLLESEPVP